MQLAQTLGFVLFLTTGCRGVGSSFEDPVRGGLLVRVVDAAGAPVAGATVRAPGRARPAQDAPVDPDRMVDFLYAGSIGRTERFGLAWRTEENGEVRIADVPPDACIAVSSGNLWGASTGRAGDERELLITLHPDESQRVVCTDREGRPGIGAFVWVGVTGIDTEPLTWCAFVNANDGSIDVPHAQHWRALQQAGRDVRVAGFVLWGDELMSDSIQKPFPRASHGPLGLEVSSSGLVDVRADESVRGEALLRWLDAPVDPDEPDETPENPLVLHGGSPRAVPLGLKLELHVAVPGCIDPRVAFDGPKKPGERVEVAIGPLPPAARVTGRLVDDGGRPMPRRAFAAWLEREVARVEAEEDWLVTDGEGRFAFDLVPGGAGTLRIQIDADVSFDDGYQVRVMLGEQARELPPPIGARHVFASSVPAGEVALGDVVCSREP